MKWLHQVASPNNECMFLLAPNNKCSINMTSGTNVLCLKTKRTHTEADRSTQTEVTSCSGAVMTHAPQSHMGSGFLQLAGWRRLQALLLLLCRLCLAMEDNLLSPLNSEFSEGKGHCTHFKKLRNHTREPQFWCAQYVQVMAAHPHEEHPFLALTALDDLCK